MSPFAAHLELGFQHILDFEGFDHMLFLVALCAAYTVREWKKLLGIVTAFTVGHCVTLILAGLGIIGFPQDITEFLIGFTIFATAIANLFHKKEGNQGKRPVVIYSLAVLFGLIHGMGFSSMFSSLIMPGQSLVTTLLAFNLGIELGQLVIVACILAAMVLALETLRIRHREWLLFLSGAAAGVSLILMTDNKFW